MKKDEVLKKARAEKNDERENQVETASYRFGWIIVTLMIILLMFFRRYYNESTTDLLLVLMTQLASTFFYQYKKLNNKNYLIAGIIMVGGIIMGFASLLSHYGVY